MITASALSSIPCGYAAVLGRSKTRTPAMEESMARGTRLHQAIDEWCRTGSVPVLDDPEINGWLQLLATQWRPSSTMLTEFAWGLSPEGKYTPVDEPEPHVYVAKDGSPLLTAGRIDAAWWQDDETIVAADWKSGKWPVTPASGNLQANASGIAMAQHMGAKAYRPTLYYARDGYFDLGDPVALGSPEHITALSLVRQAATLDEKPRVGSYCGQCWEKRRCWAYTKSQKEARP